MTEYLSSRYHEISDVGLGRLEATAWIHVVATNKTNKLIKGDDDVDE